MTKKRPSNRTLCQTYASGYDAANLKHLNEDAEANLKVISDTLHPSYARAYRDGMNAKPQNRYKAPSWIYAES